MSPSAQLKWKMLMRNERNSKKSKLGESLLMMETIRRAEEKCMETEEDIRNGTTQFDFAMSLTPGVNLEDI